MEKKPKLLPHLKQNLNKFCKVLKQTKKVNVMKSEKSPRKSSYVVDDSARETTQKKETTKILASKKFADLALKKFSQTGVVKVRSRANSKLSKTDPYNFKDEFTVK